MFCPECGKEIPDVSRFCLGCGHSMEAITMLAGRQDERTFVTEPSAVERTRALQALEDSRTKGEDTNSEDPLGNFAPPGPTRASQVVNTIDDFLQILADRDVNSEVLASLPKGAAVELGEASQLGGREWMQATVKEGTSGFVLAPSARGHTTLASERLVPAGIALTDKRARENRPDPLAGVGGWLILLLVGLLLTPVLTVYAVAVFGEIWTDPWFLTSAIGGGAIAGSSLFVAVALLNRWPTAPRLAQALLITSWSFWSGLYLMVGITGGSTQFATAVVFSIPSTILWVRYFAVSWRVHVTYGPKPVGRLRLRPAAALSIITAIAVCLGGIVVANHRRQLWSNFRSEQGFYSVDAPGERECPEFR